jgi:hypothetical protein
MRFRLTLLALLATTSFAHAQSAALDDSTKPTRTTDPTAAPDTTVTASDKVQYGVDLRLRSVWIPQGMVDLFVQRSAGGASNTGFGADFVRRHGNAELLFGFEYEHITPASGVWIQKNSDTNTADYILTPEEAGESLGWFSLEFTFVNNVPINKYVAFRYGGGAGIGFLTGGLKRWDVQCSGSLSMPVPGCVPGDKYPGVGTGTTADDDSGQAESAPKEYDLPPVFPVVNAIVGLQFKPSPKAVINIEGGIRTLPFIGLSAGYLF